MFYYDTDKKVNNGSDSLKKLNSHVGVPVLVRVNIQTVSWPHRSQGTKTWPGESDSCHHDHSRKTWIEDHTPSPPGSDTKINVQLTTLLLSIVRM